MNSTREIHYLFVDAGALLGRLKNLSRRFYGSQNFSIDFAKLAREFTKTFYYDAIPLKELDEGDMAYTARIKPQRELLDAAANVDGIHVYEGDARRRRKVGLQQKKVDVMIAVDMLTHSFRHNMHRATLLTGDNDFKPLMDALVQEGMFITLWYPPEETSAELLSAADARRPLDMRTLHGLLDADSQARFSIPHVANFPPEHDPGKTLREWTQGGVRHVLKRDGNDYVVLKDGNALNRLNLRHGDLDLLVAFCRESYGIDVPES